MQYVTRHFDVAGRDERALALGPSDEERVMHHDCTVLRQHDRDGLMLRGRLVSATDGKASCMKSSDSRLTFMIA